MRLMIPAICGCYLNDAQRMICDGDMKLIVYPGSRLVRLFDLAADPQEIHDIAGDPSKWPNIRRLFGKLINLQADMEDDFNMAKDFPELLTASDARSAWEKLGSTHMPPRLAKQSPFAYPEPVPALPNVLIYGDSISNAYTPVVRSSLKGVANVYRLYCNGGDSVGFISKVKKMEADMRVPRLEDPSNFHWNFIHFNVGLHDLKYLNGNQLDTAKGRQVHFLKQYQQNLREIIEFLQTTYPQARLIFATTTPVPAGAA